MIIQTLNLAAFGPFTDRVLVFTPQANGLHLVYGPNEAGKSSALRGLKALLYGVEERTPDNHLHANDKLRIGGSLSNANGQELTFIRRKGRKNTLMTLAGEVLDEKILVPFLQGVTADVFETLFGIDHQALLQGGQEILAQKGEVGQALFSAALGNAALHTVLERLDTEADTLFRPRGSTQIINTALKLFHTLKKEIRTCSLPSQEWQQHHQKLEQTHQEMAQIQTQLAHHRLEVNCWKRRQRILPKLARRRQLMEELALLKPTVILPDDFAARHLRAEKALETTTILFSKATSRLDGLNQQILGCSTRQDLLDHAATIEDLHARLGGHRKALQDRPHLETQRQQLFTEVELAVKEIRPDLEINTIETLHPLLARRQNITELGSQYAVLAARATQIASTLRATEKQAKNARKEQHTLPQFPSSKALRRAIAITRKLGDMDTTIQTAQSECTTLQRQCDTDLARLTLWHGALPQVASLEVPHREGILQFEQSYDELEQCLRQLRQKQQETQDALQDTLLHLDEIQNAGTVPTEADLLQARLHRDQIWERLRRQWVDDEDISTRLNNTNHDKALPKLFEERLANADELSDRLRREADRVHTSASLQAREQTLQQQQKALALRIEVTLAEKKQKDADWQAMWASGGILPRHPREMRGWGENLEKLRDQVERWQTLRQTTHEREQTRTLHTQLLNQQLVALGKKESKAAALETVLLECEETALQLDKGRQQTKALAKKIRDLETDLETFAEDHRQAREALIVWQQQWQSLLECFGLQNSTSPAEAADFIEQVRALFVKLTEAEKLQIRIKAINRDAKSFSDQVTDLTTRIAPQLAQWTADDSVMRLNTMLADNRSKQTQYQQVQRQLVQVQDEIQEAKSTIETAHKQLDALCLEARCDAYTELESAEQKSADYLTSKRAIAHLEQEILETGEGATIAQLEAETEGIDVDGIPGRIKQLLNKIEDELEPKRMDLAATKGREEKELELMNGSDQAAKLADQAQAVLASIRANAERYTRVKLASRVLRDQIECYRQENQGPLVKRASEHFAMLTINSFAGLLTDFTEKDEPILVGLRPKGEQVHVEGMSMGTRDQLYLALRLASLEKYLGSAESMPFIVDDILVDFDDQRSAAALHALAILAQKTQVIVFTHHARVVEQAKGLSEANPVQIHTL